MRARKERHLEADLDMTTFINLMVVLLAFLLVTAVFTEVATLQVNLPSNGSGAGGGAQDKKPLILEVMVYKNRFIVADRQTGPLKVIPATASGQDYKALNAYLSTIKEQYPGITEVTLLLEQNTEYDTLVHSMDSVRYKAKMVNGTWIKSALFPDIGIGDAPADTGGAA